MRITRLDIARLRSELRLLGYRPSHWAAADVVRIRSHGLSRNVHSEVARARVMCAAGALLAVFPVNNSLCRKPWRCCGNCGAIGRMEACRFRRPIL